MGEEIKNTCLIDEESIYDISDFFKILGDSTRLKILCALDNNELTVSELSSKLDMNISAVSHQLKILKANKIVKYKRNGKNIYYLLDDEHISLLINIAKTHIEEKRG